MMHSDATWITVRTAEGTLIVVSRMSNLSENKGSK